MIEWVRPLLGERHRPSSVVYECRRCGTSLDARDDRCPYCGRTEVVRYVIE